jgi:hypothetical protein
MSQAVIFNVDQRAAPRDEVHYRSRGTLPDGRTMQLLIVNMSARGMMARSEATLAEGEAIRVRLPVVGSVSGRVRWALGGRFGCELDGVIPLADYLLVLATMVAQG